MESLYDFLKNNAIYIVTFIVLIVWTGVFLYMNNLDRRLKRIEKEMKGEKNEK